MAQTVPDRHELHERGLTQQMHGGRIALPLQCKEGDAVPERLGEQRRVNRARNRKVAVV
jgi:hypothetical protein